jgi:hypothetical protein
MTIQRHSHSEFFTTPKRTDLDVLMNTVHGPTHAHISFYTDDSTEMSHCGTFPWNEPGVQERSIVPSVIRLNGQTHQSGIQAGASIAGGIAFAFSPLNAADLQIVSYVETRGSLAVVTIAEGFSCTG